MQSLRRRVWAARVFEIGVPDAFEKQFSTACQGPWAQLSSPYCVLLNLLDRLESSALFSEESCSFSQKDLVGNLTMWVEKAGEAVT